MFKQARLNKKYLSSDITIYNHADSSIKSNRLKKASLQPLVAVEENYDDDEENIKNTKNKKNQLCMFDDHIYNDYHIDIWFVISEHIKPENVGLFSLICKKTALVVSSAKFWYFLYRKYCNRKTNLPARFQPEITIKLDGLRAFTIRSLFCTYDPFIQRISSARNTTQDFHCVIKKQCISMWYNQQKNFWNFCFKFKLKMMPESRCCQVEKKLQNLKKWEIIEDVYLNKEEGCQILVITTDSFRPIQQFFGMTLYLSGITQTLSKGFTQNKIKLTFSNYCNQNIENIIFDPVTKVKVIDWWNPDYTLYIQ